MPAELTSDAKFEIGHVLFIDIVGYSKLLLNEQRSLVEALNQIVRQTNEFQTAEAEGKLVRLPTGDGMALVFYNAPEAPVECALEIARALNDHSHLKVRMGVHSGPVSSVLDVNERRNIAGAGINIAQRVMDCGDAGHILLSKRAADDLEHSGEWQVKHGARVSVVNLYTHDLGNPTVPEKLKLARAAQTKRKRSAVQWISLGVLALLAGVVAIGFLFFRNKTLVSTTGPAVQAKSIAVLPLENLSEEKENAYFADGIQDELLSNLAKIKDLKVISRTSV